jgi:hypothetical protein
MSARPSEIRDLLARAKAAKAPVSQDDPEVKAKILKNREDASARKFIEGRPFTSADDLGYDPEKLRATMKGPGSKTAPAPAKPAKPAVDAARQEREERAASELRKKQAALEKLTLEERRLLGLGG